MRALVQWSLSSPRDWEEFAVTPRGQAAQAWRRLPKKPEPRGGETIDMEPGWVYSVNVQGVQFTGFDHYAVEPVVRDGEDGLRVFGWNDDPEDWPPGERHATVWEFLDPAPDPAFGGAINTRQWKTVYAENPDDFPAHETGMGPVPVRPWAEFVPPAEQATRHGIWLTDGLMHAHVSGRTMRGWEEWQR